MSKQMYLSEKEKLKNNLYKLFRKYRDTEMGKCLITLVDAGEEMLDSVEILHIGLFSELNSDSKIEKKCKFIYEFYNIANDIMVSILEDQRLDMLPSGLMALEYQMALSIRSATFSQRVESALKAFECACLAFAGLYLIVVGAFPLLALLTGVGGALGIGALVGYSLYSLLGIVTTTIFGVMAVVEVEKMQDKVYKSSESFKETLTMFANKKKSNHNEEPPQYDHDQVVQQP